MPRLINLLEMDNKAKLWLTKKIMGDIIGCCCEISNLCGHKYPFDKVKCRWDEKHVVYPYSHGEIINQNLDKIAMLLTNFPEYVNHNKVIDEYFTEDKKKPKDKQNHWGTELHIKDFKCFVKEAVVGMRENKINNILN